MGDSEANTPLAGLLRLAEWGPRQLVTAINSRLSSQGRDRLRLDPTAGYSWVRHSFRPRTPIPEVAAAVLSERLGYMVTAAELWPGRQEAAGLSRSATSDLDGVAAIDDLVRELSQLGTTAATPQSPIAEASGADLNAAVLDQLRGVAVVARSRAGHDHVLPEQVDLISSHVAALRRRRRRFPGEHVRLSPPGAMSARCRQDVGLLDLDRLRSAVKPPISPAADRLSLAVSNDEQAIGGRVLVGIEIVASLVLLADRSQLTGHAARQTVKIGLGLRIAARCSHLVHWRVEALEQLGYSLRRDVQDRGDVSAGQALLLQLAGNLPRSRGGGTERLLGFGDRLSRSVSGFIEPAAYLWMDDHGVVGGVVVGQGLDVVADHLLGSVQVAGLSHAYAADVQFPAMLPALGAHTVGSHRNHPSGRQASFLIVSLTTPGDTMRASTITAMCCPHGQYHFW
jgi:hypothetical protein